MDVLMPQLGETVAEGKIIKWFKSVGDAVAPGENLCEIETDKVTVEVPAIAAGVLSAINAEVGTVAPVGAVIAVVSDGEGVEPTRHRSASPPPRSRADTPAAAPAPAAPVPAKAQPSDRARSFPRGSDAAPEFRPGDARLRRDGHPARPPPRRRCRHRPDPQSPARARAAASPAGTSRRRSRRAPHPPRRSRRAETLRGAHRRRPSRPTAHVVPVDDSVGQPRSGSPRRGRRSRNSISPPASTSTG